MMTMQLKFAFLAMISVALGVGMVGCDNDRDQGSATTAATANGELPECCQVPLDELPPRVAAQATAAKASAESDKATDAAAADQSPDQPQDTAAANKTDDAQSQQSDEDAKPTGAVFSDWVAPSEREDYDFDFNMTDQDGNAISLESLKGKPLAMSFMFTRCTNLQACPLLTLNMGMLEKQLAESGMGDKVNLALVSYDPKYDTPQRLKKYGSDRGIKFSSTSMLRPDVKTYPAFQFAFQQMDVVDFGNGNIDHHVDLYLFDKHGRIARFYGNGVWNNDLLVKDFKRLLAEE